MAIIVNTKLADHKSAKRLWLEGRKLDREGYVPGTRYNIEIKGSSLELVVADNGDYIVSKRERNGQSSRSSISQASNWLRCSMAWNWLGS